MKSDARRSRIRADPETARTIFEGVTCKAEYLPDRMVIYFTIFGYIEVEEHKQMYRDVLEFMKQKAVPAFVMDFKRAKGTFSPITGWVVRTLRPTLGFGLKFVAMIMNRDVFTQYAANDSIKKATAVQIQVFNHQDEAYRWIERCTGES